MYPTLAFITFSTTFAVFLAFLLILLVIIIPFICIITKQKKAEKILYQILHSIETKAKD